MVHARLRAADLAAGAAPHGFDEAGQQGDGAAATSRLPVRDAGPHAIRHTAATTCWRAAPHLRSVQEILGHASPATTQIYTHVTAERLKATYRQAHPRA